MDNGNGLVRTYEVRDEFGAVTGTREAVSYAGLLNRAHQEGLKRITTTLVQTPSEENNMTAISMAEVETTKGVFTDYGDANPENVDSMIIPHIIRMSVTRAKARALRDAINVGVVSLEELALEVSNANCGKPPNGSSDPTCGNGKATTTSQAARKVGYRGGSAPLTMHQLNKLHVLLSKKGYNDEEADVWLCQQCEVDQVGRITKRQASSLIDRLA